MIRLCKKQGLILFTCATEGRREHGTSRTDIGSSPLTVSKGWEYYKNLTEQDFKLSDVSFDDIFEIYDFFVENYVKDLYFYGIKI